MMAILPIPVFRSKAGPRSFHKLVPINPDTGGAATSTRAIEWWQTEWRGDLLVACGVHDKILSLPVMEMLAS